MTFGVIVLVLASAAAANAHSEDASFDTVSLLQAQIEQQKGTQRHVEDVGVADEYSLASALKCASQGVGAEPPTSILAEPQEKLPATAASSASQFESDDPPGAKTLRVVLQVMALLLMLNCLRLWQLEKQGANKLKHAAQAKQEEDAAWIMMVTAARSGDVSNFMKVAWGCTLLHFSVLARADGWGCTLLHFAAAGGSEAITKELLLRGAEIDAIDGADETPLHIAARAGHSSVCELLLGAASNINAVNGQGMTPLMVAGHANQKGTCYYLADCGAGVAGMADEALPPLVQSQLLRRMLIAHPPTSE